MAQKNIPYFQNDAGLKKIRIGSKKFMCVGATPPFDHPHIFLDMGEENTAICPYCATRFIFDQELSPEESDPPVAGLLSL